MINELFEGHTHMIIECLNVDYKSSRKESFMDLQVWTNSVKATGGCGVWTVRGRSGVRGGHGQGLTVGGKGSE